MLQSDWFSFFVVVFFVFFKFYLFINLFIFGCVGSSFLCEGFLQLWRAGATLHRGARASHCRGLSLQSTGSRHTGSVVVAHGPSCSAACGIFPDRGSNPCPLHQQADSQPLRRQGSPGFLFVLTNNPPSFLSRESPLPVLSSLLVICLPSWNISFLMAGSTISPSSLHSVLNMVSISKLFWINH